ncbi:hypothetical protein EV102420_14_00010, partial [Pseudescherichia vulneris NBRC 102420]
GRLHRRDVFTGSAQRPAPRRWSRRWDYDYRNNPVREERDDDPFSAYHWQYDSAGRLLSQDGTLPGREQWRWDAAGNPLDDIGEKITHNRVTQLNGIRWRYDIHGRTVEKDDGQTRWHYRYDGEHRLTEVTSQPRDRTRPQVTVSFRYDPLGRRISKTSRRTLAGQPHGREVTTRFVWEGFRLLQEIRDEVPLTYVYTDPHSHEPLARIDGVNATDIYWFHNQPSGTPERLTDAEGRVCWEAQNSAWGKLLSEREVQLAGCAQNLRMQGQYLDRETGLHYNLFRYYDPDCGRFTQQDLIGLAGGLNLYQYAPNPLGWVDPWGLSKCSVEKIPITRNSARNLLRNRGLNKQIQHDTINSFEGQIYASRGMPGDIFTITEHTPGSASQVYVTRESAGNTPALRRANLALPPSNSATYEGKVSLTRSQVLLEGKVAPQLQWGADKVGGGWQVVTAGGKYSGATKLL